jgi:hypothetical protein
MTLVAVVIAMTAADQNAELRIRTIVQGTDRRIAVHRELVIRTPGWWQFIWHEHRGSFEPPPIDFSRQMIVAVSAVLLAPDRRSRLSPPSEKAPQSSCGTGSSSGRVMRSR